MPKRQKNFASLDSLKPLEKVLNEASQALRDTGRVIMNSAIPQVLGAALGAGAGSAVSFISLYTLGTVGLSAAGITSGLAAAGALVGGGMVAGVFVLAAPVAALAVGGYAIIRHSNEKKLKQEKERLYQEALRKLDAINRQLKEEINASKERIDYLNSLIILITKATQDLKEDLEVA